jgi:type II secretory pathway pseudopilin PulG
MFSVFSHSYTDEQNYFKPAKVGGFGLIELMVSISIMVLVTTIILAKQSSFNSAVLLRSQAYEIALAVREVQMGVVSAGSDGTGAFRSVQGIYFDTGSNGTYRIFKDAGSPGNMRYDSSEEYGKQGFVDPRFEIRAIRAVGGTMAGTGLSVVFVRPNFDAKFYDSSGQINASSVEIDVARKNITGTGPSVLRTVEITATGQISVK